MPGSELDCLRTLFYWNSTLSLMAVVIIVPNITDEKTVRVGIIIYPGKLWINANFSLKKKAMWI